MLGLDGSNEFLLLCFEAVHRLSRARVEDSPRDRLDEVRELGLHVCAASLKGLQDLVFTDGLRGQLLGYGAQRLLDLAEPVPRLVGEGCPGSRAIDVFRHFRSALCASSIALRKPLTLFTASVSCFVVEQGGL